MPVSTDRHSGFPLSKWELKYLRCRYVAHRNKIASARPAIDANPPPERPHVRYKKKKALQEERRQMRVVQENLRILDRTMSIMITPDMPTHFSKARSIIQTRSKNMKASKDEEVVEEDNRQSNEQNSSLNVKDTLTSPPQSQLDTKKSKYFGRPLTARLKRNTHIIFHWFIQRFGRYVPWWAEINY